MSNSGSPVTDSLYATAASFLSAISGHTGNNDSLSGLFENLLASQSSAQNKNLSLLSNNGANKNETSLLGQNKSGSANDHLSSTLSETVSEIVTALRNFNTKWNNYQAKQSSNDGADKDCQTAKTTSGTSDTTSTDSSKRPDPSTTAAPTLAASSDNSQNPNNGTTPTLADLVAQLQSVLHMLQKNLPAASPNSSGDNTLALQATINADGDEETTPSMAQDLLAASNALGDLLALAQKFEKKSDPTSSVDATQSATGSATDPASTNTTPMTDPSLNVTNLLPSNPTATISTADTSGSADLATLDHQLKDSLKTLLDALQATASGLTSNKTPTTQDTSGNAQTDLAANAAVTNNGLTDTNTVDPSLQTNPAALDTKTAAPSDIIKSAVTVANDFLKQLNNLFPVSGTSPNATLFTANAVASTTDGRSSGFDADDNNRGDNATATSNTAPNLNAQLANLDSQKSANPYSFASQLSATRAQNGGTTGLPTAVEQVLLQLSKNVKSGNDQMTLQLHPADLGTINIKLDFASNGTVSGTVTASNADTLAMLQKDSRSLERALQEAGLRADPGSLQFSLGGQSNPNNSGQAGYQQAANSMTSGTTGDGSLAAADNDTDPTENWVITPGRINIQV